MAIVLCTTISLEGSHQKAQSPRLNRPKMPAQKIGLALRNREEFKYLITASKTLALSVAQKKECREPGGNNTESYEDICASFEVESPRSKYVLECPAGESPNDPPGEQQKACHETNQ